jgi:hypothetical protein
MNKKIILLSILFYYSLCNLMAQKSINISQFNPKFTISATRNSGFGQETYRFFVQNNTSDEYSMKITVTINLNCREDATFLLGYNRIVYLKPNGKFDATNDDNYHKYNYDTEKDKNCLKWEDGGKSVTLFNGISYEVTELRNLTQEKAAAAKKKQDDELARQQKIAEDKRKRDEEVAQKAAAAKANEEKRKQELSKKEAENKAKQEAQKKETESKAKQEATKKGTEKSKSSNTKTTENNSSKNSASSARSSENTSAKQAEQKQAEAERRNEEARQAKEAEEKRKREEQELLTKKQADYDKWKSDAQSAQNASDAASITAVGTIMFLLGEWIYNDNMGEYDPAFSFKRASNKTQFGIGIDFGYSLNSMPILFQSNSSTVSGGIGSTKKEIQPSNPFNVNFEAGVRMGAENNNFGGFGYFNGKVGVSPTLNGSNSSIQYGFRAYAGAKGIKAYVDYGMGSRNFSNSSSDVEENGEGKLSSNFNKLEYGIRITSHPNDDLRRSHFYLGIISEISKYESPNGFIDPIAGVLKKTTETAAISGFSFHWNKEHTFKFYANFYPEFVYAGEVNSGSGAISSDFKTSPTGTFFEIGFLRSLNWW